MTNETTSTPQQTIIIDGIKHPKFKFEGANKLLSPVKAGIYALLCQKTGSMYVGSSNNLTNRLKSHIRKLQTSSHANYKIQKLYDAYPNDWAWILLEPIADLSPADILRRENQYIKSGLYDLNIEQAAWASKRITQPVKPPKSTKQIIAGVFALICTATGEKLVSQSQDITKRCRSQFQDLMKHKHVNPRLQALYNEYGEDGFEVQLLERLDDRQERLDAAQRYFDSGEYPLTIRYTAA